MKTIQTEIIINAGISKVWNTLLDFKNNPQWNPFIKSIQGDQKVGSKITVSIKPPNGNGMTFKPEILVLNENDEFRWKGKLMFKGIFDGEHFFKMESIGEQKTKFIHGENFSGILVSMMGKALDNTKIGFQLMNEALKKECERS
jgi:hypothetical protein